MNVPGLVNYKEIAIKQETDKELKLLCNRQKESLLKIKQITVLFTQKSIFCDVYISSKTVHYKKISALSVLYSSSIGTLVNQGNGKSFDSTLCIAWNEMSY